MERTDIVDRYLKTLGLARQSPSLTFLRDVTSHHLAHFAFSSVGPRLGDDLPLDLESVYQRIVVRQRGGYCFEQNALLFEVLEDLGFHVSLYLGRVIFNQAIHPGLTHRITLVDLASTRYVVDVGFGAQGPRYPVPIDEQTSREGHRVFRVAELQPRELHLQTVHDGEFFSLYKFELARYGQADCEVGHFYSHKHPKANFVNNLVVSKILDSEIRSLRNLEYTTTSESSEQVCEITSAGQLRTVLTNDLGVRVTDTESQYLFENSP